MKDASRDILQIRKLRKNFGGLMALNEVSFSIKKGQIKGLIGPNGAGKTTLINIISGALKPTAGEIIFDGRAVQGLPTHKLAKLGICRTFQNVMLFSRLTVLENIFCGSMLHSKKDLISCAFYLPAARTGQGSALEKAAGIAELLGLKAEINRPAGELPLAKQRAVEIGRAIAIGPELLLLDEPGAGLTREEAVNLAGIIGDLHREKSLSILIIDHNMPLVMDLCQEIAVINFGAIIEDGPPKKILDSKAVREAYLGEQIVAG